MFESFTNLLDEISSGEHGKWVIDRENDGTPEHPIQFPFVVYDKVTDRLIDAVYQFAENHPDFELKQYSILLAEKKLYSQDDFQNADISTLDGKTVMAMLMRVIRAERFCDGAILEAFMDGTIEKLLLRLKDIDWQETENDKAEKSFVEKTARKVISGLEPEDREYMVNHPEGWRYQFTLGMQIRNRYILGKELDFLMYHPDDLSSIIIDRIIEILREEKEMKTDH